MSVIEVLKFGSSVLRGSHDLHFAVDEIYRHWRSGCHVLAVVSAFEDVTDQLINEASEIFGTCCPEAAASYVATGEQKTAALLVGSLVRCGIPARLVEPREIGLLAEGSVLAVIAVSLSWMCVVSLVPAHDRPYVDGSCNNSVFSQVFLYNGADRLTGKTLDQPGCHPAPAPAQASTKAHATTVAVPPGPGRFLNGAFGRDSDWLLVPAAAALLGILVARRREPRTDPLRAAAVLWAAWLFLTWCFFASSHFLNSYYLAALAPPIAALCGMGLAVAWRLRARRGVRAALGATVLIGTAYELYLLPTDAGVRPWIVASTLLLALGALLAVAVSLSPRRTARTDRAAVALSAAALLVGSVWASATVVAAQLGPFDSPYQAASITASDRAVTAESAAIDAGLVRAAAHIAPWVSVITSETSSGSSVPILATGREFLPVGGFTGRVPSPTLSQFVEDVWQGKVAVVLAAVSPLTRNPDMLWAIAHCRHVPYRGPDSKIAGRAMAFFVCSPADVSG